MMAYPLTYSYSDARQRLLLIHLKHTLSYSLHPGRGWPLPIMNLRLLANLLCSTDELNSNEEENDRSKLEIYPLLLR